MSWYEAAAFAEFAGKQLPTVDHWGAAASHVHGSRAGRLVIALSNFGGQGLLKAGGTRGTTVYDVYDLAGNAREWCWNQIGAGRAVRGGARDDVPYRLPRAGSCHAA